MVHLLSGVMSVLATAGSYLACNDVTYITKTGKNKYKTITSAITIATLAASVVIGTLVGKAQYSKQLKDNSEIIINLIIVSAIGVIIGIIGHVVLKMMFESASAQEEKRKQQLAILGRKEPIASNKTQLMAQFYELCQNKGYTDMRDDKQSLKAKVIATDLGLRYGNIVEFYEKAARCSQQFQAEKAEEAEKLRVQRQKEQAEKTRRAVNGRPLVTVSGGKETLKVFLRPDHTFYCTVNDGEKIEGIPSVTVHKGGSLQYTYHPSETVFTGASSGGIMMGGTHQTEAHYTERVAKSEKGYIQVSIGGTEVSVTWITMSDYTRERFKRDAQFKALVSNGRIRCTKDSEMANMLTHSALMGGGNIYAQMSQLTMAADEKRLPYETCREIANLLGRVIHGNFPPTDEEIYDCAKHLAESKTSAQLLSAIEMFQDISDYKDASTQIKSVQIKYDEVLQAEKEQAILEKEAEKKKTSKILKIVIPAICAVVAVTLLTTKVIIPNSEYNKAVSLMDAGQYEEAIAAFEMLNGFRNAEQHILSCYDGINETIYQEAVSLMEQEAYEDAIVVLQEIKDYKDSNQLIADCKKFSIEEQYKSAVELMNAGKYKNAKMAFEVLNGYKDSHALIQKCDQLMLEAKKDRAIKLLRNKNYSGALTLFKELQKDGMDVQEELQACEIKILESGKGGSTSTGVAPVVTSGKPNGEETKVFASVEGKVKLHELTRVNLDNGCVRFTLDCTAPKSDFISVFNPPNGDLFSYFTRNITEGRQTFTFDVTLSDIKAADSMTIKFGNSNGDSWIFVNNPY